MTEQPKWKYAGHVGDVDPIAYGGGFVYVDETGVYPPELVYFEPATDEQWQATEGNSPVTIYRLCLEPPRFKTLTDKGRSALTSAADLPPLQRGDTWEWHEEWFVRSLDSVAQSCGTTKFQLLRLLFSKDPRQLAFAYDTLIQHFGPFEFDQYPITMTEEEAYERYKEEMQLCRS